MLHLIMNLVILIFNNINWYFLINLINLTRLLYTQEKQVYM